MIFVEQIKMNYQNQQVGLIELPQLSWVLNSDMRAVTQKAYQVQISGGKDFEDPMYDSEWVYTSKSAQVVLPDNCISLQSGRSYFIRVRVLSNFEEKSEWSEVSVFVTGIIGEHDWVGEFISGETEVDKNKSATSCFRSALHIDKPVKEAYAFCTAKGLYQAYLNGDKIGEAVLTPGWTSYNKRLLYQTYDVSNMLKLGENIFGSIVGAGWYKGEMGFLGERNNYGKCTAFLGQIIIHFEDGTKQLWGTSEDWLVVDGPITFSEIYDGEVYDARLERPEWLNTSTADKYSNWRKVSTEIPDKSILISQPGNRPIINDRIPVQQIITTPSGDKVLDFGQNLTGWVKFKVSAPAGTEIIIECFETLDSDGNVYQENLRSAKQKIVYITKGAEEELYCPYFTFQGFRYAKLTKYPCELNKENFVALAIHSQLDETGFFECSNPLLNQLQSNIKWSLKGNFLDVPTDCPQRNERVGWTGDAQIFCRTANYLVNAHGFFAKWLKDVAADQLPEGGVPHVVPDIITGKPKVKDDWLLSQGTHSAAAWADVAVIAPWTLYLVYGDKGVLEDQYESMKSWIDFMGNHANNNIWNYKLQFGDWVALDAEEGSYFGATPNDLTCTAYYAYSTKLFSKICTVLEKEDLAQHYYNQYESIKSTYRNTFFSEDGKLLVETQTAHIISLYFNLVPQEWKSKTAKGLVDLLEKNNGHLVTGFVGTPYFCQVLSDNGYVDETYNLLLQEDFPSWLYQVKKGATTIWEHWDGIKEDGSMWSPDMNSFNHYAYGAVGDWMYRNILGIEIDESLPGYQNTILRPLVSRHLSFAKGVYKSIHGDIGVDWEYVDKQKVILKVNIPVNTTATLHLPNCKIIEDNGGVEFTLEKSIPIANISSGKYTFVYIVE